MVSSSGREGNEASASKGVIRGGYKAAAAAYSSKLNSAGSRCRAAS